jgi:polysaccharide biosynthesis/export protein
MKFIRIFLLFALPLFLFSCRTQQKLPYYLDNLTDSSGKEEVKTPELRVQKNDLLSIYINSIATDPKIDLMYNQPMNATGDQAGFLVDAKGNIEHFRLGVMHVEGLTKDELAKEIKKRLTEPVELLRDPTVTIRFLNFRVTVLGEVSNVGVVTIPGERLTIFEAIALAGGISDFGRKDSVKIIREIDGKRELGIISLADKNVFNSPFYNLVQNDKIIVSPTKEKGKDAEQAKIAQKISFAFTLVTVAATLANIFIK